MKRNIIIADNQGITRCGLEALLAEGDFFAGCVFTAHDRKTLAGLLSINEDAVVILDYTLFDFYGFEQLLNLASRYEKSSWLLFSDDLGKSFVRNVCIRNQFNAVMKGDRLDEISDALRATYGYWVYRCQLVEKILKEDCHRPGETEKLTPSEVSILREISLGRSTKEIAAGRFLSFHTVNSHRKNIFRKLGVNNVQEAIRYALRAGIIDMADYNI